VKQLYLGNRNRHMYIYSFLLRMTDTMTSQNTDLSSWGILYVPVPSMLFQITELLAEFTGNAATVLYYYTLF
jgi:hypothetical protein